MPEAAAAAGMQSRRQPLFPNLILSEAPPGAKLRLRSGSN